MADEIDLTPAEEEALDRAWQAIDDAERAVAAGADGTPAARKPGPDAIDRAAVAGPGGA